MMMFIKTFLLSMKRRKKEIRFVSLATFIAVLLMSSLSLFQNVMNRYLMENNYRNYGEWVLSAVGRRLEHPYFKMYGSCDTGADILDETGGFAGIHLGSVDENFLKLSSLSFYEGRMPENDDEIVMTLASLAKLGYSYDLGQTIHITAFWDENIVETQFTLVGTIKDFSKNWNHAAGFELPSCIVTREALLSVGGIDHTTNFFQLDRTYEEIHIKEFTTPFLEEISEMFPVTYNSYVYDNQMWGSHEMFQRVQLILIVIAVLVISYLMMSYVTKRRKWYYQMRSTGASKKQIWAMILLEGAYGTLPWAAAAMLLSYVLGASFSSVAAKRAQLGDIFQIDIELLILQIGAILGIVLIALFAACLSSGDKRLGSNVHEITKRQLKRLKRSAKRSVNVAKSFSRRQNRLHPFQSVTMGIFSVVVCGILVLCMHVLYREYLTYKDTVEGSHDFSATKIVEWMDEFPYRREYEDGTVIEGVAGVGGDATDIYRTEDGTVESQIEVLDGIKSIRKDFYDTEQHHLVWEGRENSPIIPMLEKYCQSYTEADAVERLFPMFTYFHDDYEWALDVHGPMIGTEQIDEDAFNNGEQAILILDEYLAVVYDEYGNFQYEDILHETTLQTGDIVSLKRDRKPGVVEVEVVVLSYSDENHLKLEGSGYDTYTLIGSKALVEKLASENGDTLQYSEYTIDFEPNSSFSATSKNLASLFSENDWDYWSPWETRAEARNTFIRSLCVYGVLFLIILSVYLILQMNLNQMKNYHRIRKYQILKRLGMSDSFFMKMMAKEGIREALWVLPGVLLGYGMVFLIEWIEAKQFYYLYLKDFPEKVLGHALDNMWMHTSLSYVIVFAIIFMAAVIGIVYLSAKQAMKKEGNIL